jgi:hypothetical protein
VPAVAIVAMFLAFLTLDRAPETSPEIVLQIERPATLYLGLTLPERNPRRG